MPAKSSMTYKLERSYRGPYSVVRVVENGVEVRPVDKPYSATTLVALNQVYRCPEEMPNVFWPQKDVFASSLGPTIASWENLNPNETKSAADWVSESPAVPSVTVLLWQCFCAAVPVCYISF